MKPYTAFSDPSEIVMARRTELSLTQAELARRLNYPNVSFISMLEAKRSKVPLNKAPEIAEALEIEPLWFIERVLRERAPALATYLAEPIAEYQGKRGRLRKAS